ncbi:hypothetical protein SAMN05444000_13719, partial [Shimia gijangensis]
PAEKVRSPPFFQVTFADAAPIELLRRKSGKSAQRTFERTAANDQLEPIL